MSDYKDWLRFTEGMVLEAGKIVKSLYNSSEQTTFKIGLDDRPSTVTEADTQSENYLSGALREKFPNHGIYGEEGTNINTENDFVWYIDPLDGTTNFWRHIPLFGISVGLAYKQKPVLGVLYFPELNLLISAYEGGGAFSNNKKLKVSSRTLEKSLYYVSCQELRDGMNFPSLGQSVGWTRAIDVSSFEFAQIAMGNAELYTFTKPSPQDMVAGTIIVCEAGGAVTDENSRPWITSAKSIVASNGVIHEKVMDLLN